MIKYNLKCSNDHEFKSWFSDSNEFDKLNNKKLLECIYCSSSKIQKSIMAPMVSGGKLKEDGINLLNEKLSSKKNELLQIRKYIEKNFEDVGERFSQEARNIHYDKKTSKGIYGKATPEETSELIEEGIDVCSLPWVNDKLKN